MRRQSSEGSAQASPERKVGINKDEYYPEDDSDATVEMNKAPRGSTITNPNMNFNLQSKRVKEVSFREKGATGETGHFDRNEHSPRSKSRKKEKKDKKKKKKRDRERDGEDSDYGPVDHRGI